MMERKRIPRSIALLLFAIFVAVVAVALARNFVENEERFKSVPTSALQLEMEQAEAVYLKARSVFKRLHPEVKKVQELIVKYEADNNKLCKYLLISNYRDIFVQDAKNTESLLVVANTIKKLAEQGVKSQIISNPSQNFNLLFSLSVLSNVFLLETSRDEADCRKSRHV